MNWSRLHTAEPCMRHWENSQRSSKPRTKTCRSSFFFFSFPDSACNGEEAGRNRRILLAKNRCLLSTRDSCVIRFESIQRHYRHDFLVIRAHCVPDTDVLANVCTLPPENWQRRKISRSLSLAFSVRINVHVYLFERKNGTGEVPRIKTTTSEVLAENGTSTTSEKRL